MLRTVTFFCLTLLLACSESEFASAPSAKAGRLQLEISPESVNLAVGEKQKFTATAVTAGGKKKIVTDESSWSVSAQTVATIDQAGGLTTVSPGQVTVTATYEEATASASVTVTDATLLEIKVTPEEESIGVGDKVSYKAVGTYEGGIKRDITSTVTWKTDRPISAVFSEESAARNVLTGLQMDEVTVAAEKDGVEGTAKLTITDTTIVGLAIEPLDQVVPVETMVEYKATAQYSDGTTRDVTSTATWSSANPLVASFSITPGMMHIATAITKGTTQVKADYNGLQATTSLTVQEIEVTAITVTPELASISVNGTVQYKAVATFANNSQLDVTRQSIWKVSDESLARISNAVFSSGEAVGLAAGTVNVFAEFREKKSNDAVLNISNLPPTLFKITVTKAGTGSGAVTSNPGGISCGDTCQADYANGTSLTLTAAASADSVFAGWSGACSGANVSCTVTVDSAKSVQATFTKKTYTLTVTKSGTGTGTVTSNPAGVTCGNTCAPAFVTGTSVVLTAAPAADSVFSGWSGACSGSNLTCTVTMDAAKTVNAQFTKPAAPTCTITSSYRFYDAKFDRKVSAVFSYTGLVTTATIGGKTVNASGLTHEIAAANGTISGSATGPGGTGTCSLTVTVTSPTPTFVNGDIVTFSNSNGTPGVGRLNFKLTNKDSRLVITGAGPKTLSTDFKYESVTIGANTAVSGGKHEQTFAIQIKFRYTPDSIVQYNGQMFQLMLKDTVTNATYNLDVPIVLRICKQESLAVCNTGTPNSQFSGTAGHPNAAPGNL